MIVIFALILTGIVAYHRLGVASWAALMAALLLAFTHYDPPAHPLAWACGIIVVSAFGLLPSLRRPVSAIALAGYRKVLPVLSETERVALEAGSVGFEGELFTGRPAWGKLLSQPRMQLSAEETDFLENQVSQACRMANDWQITHQLADLPLELWDYLRHERFFGMIIPREYGGLGFSASAHHLVIQKLASVSTVLSSTVGVPNSLGPGELIMHYGTPAQKAHYLPRLASGEDMPCFALTGPFAGSDATSIPDYGVVCMGSWEGEEVLGVRLTFDKRYITLAPVATLIGLAFKMQDPDGLLGPQVDRGICIALLPRSASGVEIGRRHFPLNIPFHNGPLSGQGVFLPLSQLIGGPECIGQGWKMLVECLSIGRSITLPSTSSGGAKLAAVTTGAYARIRKQFGLPIGRFEGVEEALARIAGRTYAISALAHATAQAVDRGEKPAVPSAIAKYHCTEMGRDVVKDAMDVHGGKGIILGPRNYLGRSWQGSPIGITVEGANIMTRSLMIFGQGAILCHPWVLREMRAANLPEKSEAVREFDLALWGHVGFFVSNLVRSFWMGITASRLGKSWGDRYTARFYRKATRYSAALALSADVSMLVFGGRLKFKEKLSGRLGDVLSQLYLVSAMLKRYEDEGRPAEERPLLAWAMHDAFYKTEHALFSAFKNYPVKWIGTLLSMVIFPLGRRAQEPGDRLGHRVASILLSPSPARDSLVSGLYLEPGPNHPAARLVASLPECIHLEPAERKFQKALKQHDIAAWGFPEQLEEGQREGWITAEEVADLLRLRSLVLDAISVDDFAPEELSRLG